MMRFVDMVNDEVRGYSLEGIHVISQPGTKI